MKTQNKVQDARVQSYSFDNGSLEFTIDHDAVKKAVREDESLIDAMIAIGLKTLIHRTSARPAGKGEDATEWLIEAIAGGEAGGRFRITAKDKERATSAMKSFKLAPSQTAEQFRDNNGIDYLDDEAFLSRHYMSLRAKKAAQEKAEQSML